MYTYVCVCTHTHTDRHFFVSNCQQPCGLLEELMVTQPRCLSASIHCLQVSVTHTLLWLFFTFRVLWWGYICTRQTLNPMVLRVRALLPRLPDKPDTTGVVVWASASFSLGIRENNAKDKARASYLMARAPDSCPWTFCSGLGCIEFSEA